MILKVHEALLLCFGLIIKITLVSLVKVSLAKSFFFDHYQAITTKIMLLTNRSIQGRVVVKAAVTVHCVFNMRPSSSLLQLQ